MNDDRERRAPVALIAAGGSGKRLGADGPKALVQCAGRSLLQWSLAAFANCEGVTDVVVAVVEAEHERFELDVAPARRAGLNVKLCAGGESRSHSVRAALETAIQEHDPSEVLVHDAARPLAGPDLIDACLNALRSDSSVQCVVPAAPVVDTIKQTDADMAVTTTPARSTLWAVQTPQAFRCADLARVLGLDPSAPVADETIHAATDDASLIERAGGRVVVMPWTAANPKVTTAADLELVERLLSTAQTADS